LIKKSLEKEISLSARIILEKEKTVSLSARIILEKEKRKEKTKELLRMPYYEFLLLRTTIRMT